MLKKLILLVVCVVFVGVIVQALTDPSNGQRAAKERAAEAKAQPKQDPMEKEAIRIAREYYKQLEPQLYRVNPKVAYREWSGSYTVHPYSELDGNNAWNVHYRGDRDTGFCKWGMVVCLDKTTDKWALIRCKCDDTMIVDNRAWTVDETGASYRDK